MTHAALIPEERRSFDLSELVLLPFALMLALFRCFFGEKLQWARRQRRSRPMPTNWRQHYDRLRLAEWSVVDLPGPELGSYCIKIGVVMREDNFHDRILDGKRGGG
jgi:hypothetical protein